MLSRRDVSSVICDVSELLKKFNRNLCIEIKTKNKKLIWICLPRFVNWLRLVCVLIWMVVIVMMMSTRCKHCIVFIQIAAHFIDLRMSDIIVIWRCFSWATSAARCLNCAQGDGIGFFFTTHYTIQSNCDRVANRTFTDHTTCAGYIVTAMMLMLMMLWTTAGRILIFQRLMLNCTQIRNTALDVCYHIAERVPMSRLIVIVWLVTRVSSMPKKSMN